MKFLMGRGRGKKNNGSSSLEDSLLTQKQGVVGVKDLMKINLALMGKVA